MTGWVNGLTFAASLGTAVVTGPLFSFSAFAMRSLGRLPSAQGIRAMQAISVDIKRPPFLLPFLGTAVACAVLVVHGARHLDSTSDVLRTAGAVLYLVGPLGITMFYNEPRNQALERTDPDTQGAGEFWQRYRREWQPANHVRTVMGVAALGLLIAALQAD
jgi:uncharacterized membrane protein